MDAVITNAINSNIPNKAAEAALNENSKHALNIEINIEF